MTLTARFYTFGQWLLELLLTLWGGAKVRYNHWYAKTYQPEQETSLELKRLTNEELKGIGGYIWSTAAVNFMTLFILVMVLVMVVLAAADTIQKPHLLGTYLVFMVLPALMLFGQFVVMPDNSRLCLRRILMPVWAHPSVKEMRQKYRYFYLNGDKMVFTNAKPFFLLTDAPYERTDVDWTAYKKNRVRAALDWALMSTFYLRFVWPFILSPMQLAFLAYWRATRKTEFKKGYKVLMIGSGPLPYHCWWKSRLGSDGHIIALDIDPYVNRTSRVVETLFEFLRGLLFGRRWVSTHVTGDAEELPFAAGTFDIVVSIRCYHVNFEEALRVLKPKGKLLVDGFSQVAKVDHDKQQIAENTGDWWLVTA